MQRWVDGAVCIVDPLKDVDFASQRPARTSRGHEPFRKQQIKKKKQQKLFFFFSPNCRPEFSRRNLCSHFEVSRHVSCPGAEISDLIIVWLHSAISAPLSRRGTAVRLHCAGSVRKGLSVSRSAAFETRSELQMAVSSTNVGGTRSKEIVGVAGQTAVHSIPLVAKQKTALLRHHSVVVELVRPHQRVSGGNTRVHQTHAHNNNQEKHFQSKKWKNFKKGLNMVMCFKWGPFFLCVGLLLKGFFWKCRLLLIFEFFFFFFFFLSSLLNGAFTSFFCFSVFCFFLSEVGCRFSS